MLRAGASPAPGNLIKQGNGTFTLNGTGTNTNTYTGLTHVQGGTLAVGGGFAGDGAIQGDVTIDASATLDLNQSNVVANGSDFTINGTLDMSGLTDAIGNIQGSGDIINHTNNGTGLTLDDLSGTHTFTGDISGGGSLLIRGNIDNSGTLELSGGVIALGNLRIGDGEVTIKDNATVTATSGTVVATNRNDIPGIDKR